MADYDNPRDDAVVERNKALIARIGNSTTTAGIASNKAMRRAVQYSVAEAQVDDEITAEHVARNEEAQDFYGWRNPGTGKPVPVGGAEPLITGWLTDEDRDPFTLDPKGATRPYAPADASARVSAARQLGVNPESLSHLDKDAVGVLGQRLSANAKWGADALNREHPKLAMGLMSHPVLFSALSDGALGQINKLASQLDELRPEARARAKAEAEALVRRDRVRMAEAVRNYKLSGGGRLLASRSYDGYADISWYQAIYNAFARGILSDNKADVDLVDNAEALAQLQGFANRVASGEDVNVVAREADPTVYENNPDMTRAEAVSYLKQEGELETFHALIKQGSTPYEALQGAVEQGRADGLYGRDLGPRSASEWAGSLAGRAQELQANIEDAKARKKKNEEISQQYARSLSERELYNVQEDMLAYAGQMLVRPEATAAMLAEGIARNPVGFASTMGSMAVLAATTGGTGVMATAPLWMRALVSGAIATAGTGVPTGAEDYRAGVGERLDNAVADANGDLAAVLDDPALLKEIKDRAKTHAVVTGAAGALTQMAPIARVLRGHRVSTVGNAVAFAAGQTMGGMAGEAAGQIAADGGITDGVSIVTAGFFDTIMSVGDIAAIRSAAVRTAKTREIVQETVDKVMSAVETADEIAATTSDDVASATLALAESTGESYTEVTIDPVFYQQLSEEDRVALSGRSAELAERLEQAILNGDTVDITVGTLRDEILPHVDREFIKRFIVDPDTGATLRDADLDAATVENAAKEAEAEGAGLDPDEQDIRAEGATLGERVRAALKDAYGGRVLPEELSYVSQILTAGFVAMSRSTGIRVRDLWELYGVKQFKQMKAATGTGGVLGAYKPAERAIYRFGGGNHFTLLHEIGHLFLDARLRLYDAIENGTAPEKRYESLAREENLFDFQGDMRELAKWLGIEPSKGQSLYAAYESLPEERVREIQEKFAKSFEQYLASGQAPAVKFRKAFRAFRTWVASTYAAMTGMEVPRGSYTDVQVPGNAFGGDVRRIFDAILLSSRTVQEINVTEGYAPIFGKDTPVDKQVFQAIRDEASELTAEHAAQMAAKVKTTARAILKAMRKAGTPEHEALDAVRKEIARTPYGKAHKAFAVGKVVRSNSKKFAELSALPNAVTSKNGVVHLVTKVDADELIALGYTDEQVRLLRDTVGLATNKKAHAPLPLEQLAKMWGFDSGRDLADAFLLEPSYRGKLEAETLRRLLPERLKEDPDFADVQLASDVLYNTARAEAQIREYERLSRMRNYARKYSRVELEALAKAKVDRLTVEDIRRGAFTKRHLLSEIKRLEMSAAERYKAGDYEGALNDLGDAYVKTRIVADLRGTRKMLDKLKAFCSKYGTASAGAKTISIEAREAIQKIVSLIAADRFDEGAQKMAGGEPLFDEKGNPVREPSTRVSGEERKSVQYKWSPGMSDAPFSEFLARVRTPMGLGKFGIAPDLLGVLDLGHDAALAYVNRLSGARAVLALLQDLEHVGRVDRRDKLEARAQQVERDIQVLASNIDAHETNRGRKAKVDQREATGITASIREGMRKAFAAHLRALPMLEGLAGGLTEPLMRVVVTPVMKACSKNERMRADYTKRLTELFRGLRGVDPGHTPEMQTAYHKRSTVDGFDENTKLSIQEAFVMLLNFGNAGNRARLLQGLNYDENPIFRGQKVTERDLLNIFSQFLGEEHFAAADKVWAMFGELQKQTEETQVSLTNTRARWVEAEAFTVRFPVYDVESGGVVYKERNLTGGYYPIVYDSYARKARKSGNVVEPQDDTNITPEALRAHGYVSSVSDGHLQDRAAVPPFDKSPLTLTMRGLASGLDAQIQYIAMAKVVADLHHLFCTNNALTDTIRKYKGAEAVDMFSKWVGDMAQSPLVSMTGAELLARMLRRSVSFAGLAYNVTSAIVQVTGYVQTVATLGPTWALRGLARAMNPIGARERYHDMLNMSTIMATRQQTQLRELAEVSAMLSASKIPGVNYIQHAGYKMLSGVQMMVDIPTWYAAFDKAVAEGRTEVEAAHIADVTVETAQGTGRKAMLSGLERNADAFSQLLTVFYSFFNTTLNAAVMLNEREVNVFPRLMGLTTLLVAQPMMDTLLRDTVKYAAGDDDAYDDALIDMLASVPEFNMGMFVVLRELSAIPKYAIKGTAYDYHGPTGFAKIDSLYRLEKKMLTEKGRHFATAKDRAEAIRALGIFGVPSSAITAFDSGQEALRKGRTDNPLVLLTGYKK